MGGIISFCVRLVQRWLPEPFIFAILLTLLAAVLSMPICHQTLVEVVLNWGGGVWSLLGFSMQMALVLVGGSALAEAPVVRRGIDRLAVIPKSPMAAIALVTVVSSLTCWLNWGFGLIVGAIFAKAVARRLHGVDYRLLIASAYSGFVVWHAGISGSIPLAMATDGDSLAKTTNGYLTTPVPLDQTLFDWHNVLMVILVIVAITVVNTLMHPRADVVTIDPSLLDVNDDVKENLDKHTPASRMENSRWLSWILSLLGISYLLLRITIGGGTVDLGFVIMLFLFAGLLLHGTPIAYVRAFTKATSSAAGIILQFPFYAGIMGIITGVGASGICLATVISDACIAISTPSTYPLLSFISAGVVNLFVPSGGGQWAVQAPIMFAGASQLGVDSGLTGMAIAWGDAWTNLIQPFWALPALAIAGLSAKDIMGFCLVDLVVSGIIIAGGLLLWAM
ncbi:MAG: short-chain fatty acid transporter [Bacteroidales bacterium]|nr:short-chain fatty acid transporter [Candidatus Colimorpha onthohippi]